MTFKEFNLSIMKDPTLGKLLPLAFKRTYPMLTLRGENLCATFVGFKIRVVNGKLEAQVPKYCLSITYPQCRVKSFVIFNNEEDKWNEMEAKKPEAIQELSSLCDKAFNAFDNKSEELENILEKYNSLLKEVLDDEHHDVLESILKLESRR